MYLFLRLGVSVWGSVTSDPHLVINFTSRPKKGHMKIFENPTFNEGNDTVGALLGMRQRAQPRHNNLGNKGPESVNKRWNLLPC